MIKNKIPFPEINTPITPEETNLAKHLIEIISNSIDANVEFIDDLIFDDYGEIDEEEDNEIFDVLGEDELPESIGEHSKLGFG